MVRKGGHTPVEQQQLSPNDFALTFIDLCLDIMKHNTKATKPEEIIYMRATTKKPAPRGGAKTKWGRRGGAPGQRSLPKLELYYRHDEMDRQLEEKQKNLLVEKTEQHN